MRTGITWNISIDTRASFFRVTKIACSNFENLDFLALFCRFFDENHPSRFSTQIWHIMSTNFSNRLPWFFLVSPHRTNLTRDVLTGRTDIPDTAYHFFLNRASFQNNRKKLLLKAQLCAITNNQAWARPTFFTQHASLPINIQQHQIAIPWSNESAIWHQALEVMVLKHHHFTDPHIIVMGKRHAKINGNQSFNTDYN